MEHALVSERETIDSISHPMEQDVNVSFATTGDSVYVISKREQVTPLETTDSEQQHKQLY